MYHQFLGFVTVVQQSTAPVKEQSHRELQITDHDSLLSYYAIEPFSSNSTWKINQPTCILTAIDSEFSSLSSSLRTTSFFSVRLHSLWSRKGTRASVRKKCKNPWHE